MTTSRDAGEYRSWLQGMQAALRGQGDAEVPCGSCTACCTSSQFIHVAPDETDVLAVIPAALLFPAPGLPAGHVLLGYDANGHCPMFTDGACSIYGHRPRTCRVYDCRLLAAVGRADDAKPLIAARIAEWQFTYADDASEQLAADVRAAGRIPEA